MGMCAPSLMVRWDAMTGMCDRTKSLKHFLNGGFIGIDHDALVVQHQDIHGQPFGGHPQWVVYADMERLHLK